MNAMKIKRADAIIIAVLILIIAAGLVVPSLSGAGSRQGSSQAAGSKEAASKDAGGGSPESAGSEGAETTDSEVPAISYEDYNGKKIGILTGTNMEQESFKYFPDSEYFYYDGYPNLNFALDAGVIDAYLGDEPALRCIHAEQPQIDYIRERLTNNSYSFAFRKDDEKEKKLCDQFNQFLRNIKADGTYDEIDATWFGADEDKKFVDMSGLTGENGTIHVITTSTDEPFS
jgi:polar amino acid transport system substrate-binding protein